MLKIQRIQNIGIKKIKKSEGLFVGGKKEGVWNKWNEKGQLFETETFKTGSLILLRQYEPKDNEIYHETNFYDSGIKKSEGKIVLENKDGDWNYYNTDGSLIEVKNYKNGLDGDELKKLKEKKNNNNDFDTDGYLSGEYIDLNGVKARGYLKIDHFGSLRFKRKLDEKSQKLKLSELTSYYFGAQQFVKIKSVKIKACTPIGQAEYNDLMVKLVLSGKINLYSTTIQCNGMSSSGSVSSFKSNEIYIIQKGNDTETNQIRLGNKINRETFLKLFEDNIEIQSELAEEVNKVEVSYSTIISIINKYNTRQN